MKSYDMYIILLHKFPVYTIYIISWLLLLNNPYDIQDHPSYFVSILLDNLASEIQSIYER